METFRRLLIYTLQDRKRLQPLLPVRKRGRVVILNTMPVFLDRLKQGLKKRHLFKALLLINIRQSFTRHQEPYILERIEKEAVDHTLRQIQIKKMKFITVQDCVVTARQALARVVAASNTLQRGEKGF